MVEVTADAGDISNKDDTFFLQFDLVVATNCSSDQLVTTSNSCEISVVVENEIQVKMVSNELFFSLS